MPKPPYTISIARVFTTDDPPEELGIEVRRNGEVWQIPLDPDATFPTQAERILIHSSTFRGPL